MFNASSNRFQRLLLSTVVAGGAALPMVSLLAPTAKAEDCTAMLKPVFNLVKGSARPPVYAYATVSKQFASKNTNGTSDNVDYSNGILDYKISIWGAPILLFKDTFAAELETRWNNKNFFQTVGKHLKLAISSSGQLSLQELIYSKSSAKWLPIGGLPPKILQANCSGGLLTKVDGSSSWVVSLTTQPFEDVSK